MTLRPLWSAVFLFCLMVLGASSAKSQGGSTTSRLAGIVRDAQDAVIPNALVEVTNNLTGATFKESTNELGAWTIPALQNGIYTVRIQSPGFKIWLATDVTLSAASPTTVNPRLEVGGTDEQVTVLGAESALKTETAAVTLTVTGRQIRDLPLPALNAMQLIPLLPGMQTPGTPRTTSVSGLRKSAMNVTLDGANIQENIDKTGDGFFTSILPKPDAVEEVTITSAVPGAESTSGGPVQVQFITRSGSNAFHGGAFWQHRNDALNSNYYFNTLSGLPKTRIILNQFGAHAGGPISVPRVFSGHDRAFFFADFEELHVPQGRTVTRTVLTDSARNGIFTYKDTTGGMRTVNLYQIAGSKGFTSSPDPKIFRANSMISEAAARGVLQSRGVTNNDYNRLNLIFQDPQHTVNRFWTSRLDFNLSRSHHLTLTYHFQNYFTNPNGTNVYPGLGSYMGPTAQSATYYRNAFAAVFAERWTLSPSLVNEIRFSSSGNGSAVSAREFNAGNFGLFNGYAVNTPYIYGYYSSLGSLRANAPVKYLQDNLSWTRGRHLFSLGFTLTRISNFARSSSYDQVPQISLGYASGDPATTGASNMFDAVNFPNSTAAQQTEAQNLYALVTGRISSTYTIARLDETTRQFERVPLTHRNHQQEYGLFVQDAWKAATSLTLNYGLRWEIDPSPVNDTGIYTRVGEGGVFGVSGRWNVFNPGVYKGNLSQYRLLEKGERAFKTHLKEFAPSLGFAWSPNVRNGLLAPLFGNGGKTVLRGGYALAFLREGIDTYVAMFGNSGGQLTALGVDFGNYPAEFGEPGSRQLRDGTYPFLPLPSAKFPMTVPQGSEVDDFNAHLKPGYVQSWSFGVQRELAKYTTLEIRYVGNHGTRLWRQYAINEVNIFENGFLDEFKIAAGNLAIARNLNPVSNNFGNQNLQGQKPIPIIATALGFTNDLTTATTIAQGQAGLLAAQIALNITRMNRLIGANLVPAITLRDPNDANRPVTLSNWFVANPRSPASSYIMENGADSNYHSLQIEFNRRVRSGLMMQGSYVFSKSLGNMYSNSALVYSPPTTLRSIGFDKGPDPRDMRNAIKANWIFELPVGPGRRFRGGTNRFVGKVLEGWQGSGVARIQSGTPTRLQSGRWTFNNNESGVVLMNMTAADLQAMLKIRKETVCGSTGQCRGVVYWLPQNLIDNTMAAFQRGGKTLADLKPDQPYIAPPTMPGALGSRVFVYSPWTSRFDFSLSKRTRIKESVALEFRAQFLNAFNQAGITIQSADTDASNGAINDSFGQTASGYRDFNLGGTADPGGRLIEFQLRIIF